MNIGTRKGVPMKIDGVEEDINDKTDTVTFMESPSALRFKWLADCEENDLQPSILEERGLRRFYKKRHRNGVSS